MFGFGYGYDRSINYLGEFNPLEIEGLQLYLNKDLGVNTKVCADFDGVNQYLSSASTDFKFGNESFSIGGWIKFDVTGGFQTLAGVYNANTSNASYIVYKNSSDKMLFSLSNDGGTTTGTVTHSQTLSAGTWYFVFGVYDSVNDLIKISIDGGAFQTSSYSGGAYSSATENFRVGTFTNSGGTDFFLNGKQDGLNVYSKALTFDEVQGLYNSGSGMAYDNLPTLLGDEYAIAQDFNGTDQYLSSASTDFDKTNTDFSFGAWVKIDTLDNRVIIGKVDSGVSYGYSLFLQSSGIISVRYSSDGTTAVAVASSSTLVVNTWYFITCVYDFDNLLAKISINGTEFDTGVLTSSIHDSTSDFTLGTAKVGGAFINAFDGKVDSPFFYDKALSFAEVQALYNAGNGITHTNLPTLTGTEYAIGQSFDGASNLSNSTNGWNIGYQSFAFGGWMKFDDVSLTQTVFGKWGSIGDYSFRVYTVAGILYVGYSINGTSTSATNLGAISNDTWYHIVVSRDQPTQTWSISLNGAAFTTDTKNISTNVTASLSLGSASNSVAFFKGVLQNWFMVTGGNQLDITEANEIYNGGVGLNYDGLSPSLASKITSWWNLSDTEGSTYVDSTGVADMSLTNGAVVQDLGITDNTTLPNMETDLTAWWEMNDVEGAWQSNLADTVVDNAVVFDGVDDALNIDAALTPLASTTVGTIEFDVKLGVSGVLTRFVAFGDTDADTFLTIYSNGFDKVGAYFTIGGVNYFQVLTDSAQVFTANFVNIKAVQDGVSLKLLIDDVEVAQTYSISTDKTKWFNDAPLLDNGRVACYNYNSLGDSLFTNANIQSLKFYDDATQTNLVAHYDFADKDDLGNDIVGGYDGTLIGTPYATPLNGDLVPNNTPVSALGKVTDTTLGNQETDLVSWWELNETSGTRYDEVGANNLTDNNSVGYALGHIQEPAQVGNQATYFNGTTDAYNMDSVLSALASTTVGTWEFDVKPTDATPTNTEVYFCFADASADNRINTYIDNTGRFGLAVSVSGVLQVSIRTTGVAFTSGVWANVKIIQDGVLPKILIDDVEVAQSTIVGVDTTLWFNDLPLLDNGRIGCIDYNGGGNQFFSDITMQNVKIYDDATQTNLVAEFILNSLGSTDGNYSLTEIGSPTFVEGQIPSELVSQWVDQSTNMFVLSQDTVTRQPLLTTNSIDFDGVDDNLSLAVADVFGSDTVGSFYCGFIVGALASINVLLSTADNLTNDYFINFQKRASNVIAFQCNDGTGTKTFEGSTVLTEGEYAFFRVTQSGSAISIFVNGSATAETLTIMGGDTLNDGRWFGTVSNRDNLTLSSLVRPITNYYQSKSVKLIYSNASLTDSQIAQINNFMSNP